MRTFHRFDCRGGDRGATAVEYGLLVGLIAGVIAATVALIGPALLPGFESVIAQL